MSGVSGLNVNIWVKSVSFIPSARGLKRMRNTPGVLLYIFEPFSIPAFNLFSPSLASPPRSPWGNTSLCAHVQPAAVRSRWEVAPLPSGYSAMSVFCQQGAGISRKTAASQSSCFYFLSVANCCKVMPRDTCLTCCCFSSRISFRTLNAFRRGYSDREYILNQTLCAKSRQRQSQKTAKDFCYIHAGFLAYFYVEKCFLSRRVEWFSLRAKSLSLQSACRLHNSPSFVDSVDWWGDMMGEKRMRQQGEVRRVTSLVRRVKTPERYS